MLSRFICRPCAKGKPISPNLWNISFNSLLRRWTKPSKPSLRQPCAPWFAIAGPATFESCKTTSRAASFFPMMESLNQRHSRVASHWSQRFQIRRLKKRCVEKFSRPASAQIGSSEVHEVQTARLGLKRTTLFYKIKRLGIAPPADHSQD